MSRNGSQQQDGATQPWSFLTNHARVLVCIAGSPQMTLREIGDAVGITERTTHRIVADLVEAGYITRARDGRQNRYRIDPDRPVPDRFVRDAKVGELLRVLKVAAT